MIIAKFKFEGETIKATIPSNWDEMKVRHYLALETTKNPLELMALLSDVDLTKILNTRTDMTPIINKLIELLNSEPPNFKEMPKRLIEIDGQTVKIPTDFTKITFGQSAMIETYLGAADGDERKAIAQIMAVILQPILDKKPFDLGRAAIIEDKINELPIRDVFPNIFFFWQGLIKYMIIGLKSYKQYQTLTPRAPFSTRRRVPKD